MKVRFNNKKILPIIAVTLVVAGVIGVTFALSGDRSAMPNQFAVADYTIAYTEDFTAPQNWQPCEETPKTFTVKNEGNAPVNVRIRYEDYWRNKVDTQDLQPIKDGVTLAIINFQNEDDWTLRSDGYYYYKELLQPGATTSSLFKSVTLNCDANFDKDNICTKTANGTVCEKPADEYEGATYHLRIVAETKQAGADTFNAILAEQANPRDYQIDFTRKAVVSNDVFVANGNGVNRYTENGKEIYYYRGEINNNNVIWAGFCWKIIRSTATGGTKMIYNGAPSTVDGKKQCNATGQAASINSTYYRFSESSMSPTFVGYMYGARVDRTSITPGSNTYIFSNNVTRSGNTYTLDTSEGQSISGTWSTQRLTAATRYHYFCTNGAASCSNTQIGYIHHYLNTGTIYYLPLNGYDDIEDMKNKMFVNTNDSLAKSTIETWFEEKGLVDHEDDLEDVVYCNDRTLYSGALKSKDSDGTPDTEGQESSFIEVYNTIHLNDDGNIQPNLDCSNRRDSFTKSSENGNGKLKHKVGLITASEESLAGLGHRANGLHNDNYLYSGGLREYSMSPLEYNQIDALVFMIENCLAANGVYELRPLRPVVSLKAGTTFVSGNGQKTNPYIVE